MQPADASLRLEYAREPAISATLDGELRELISGCFDRPHTAFFKERRFAQEMPLHRHLLRDGSGKLVAHLAVHVKRVTVAREELVVGGIAEVCVHETQRGRGHVGFLLRVAEQNLLENGSLYAILFGEVPVYASSGYRPIGAPIRRLDPVTQREETGLMPLALVHALSERPWPEGLVDLHGPAF